MSNNWFPSHQVVLNGKTGHRNRSTFELLHSMFYWLDKTKTDYLAACSNSTISILFSTTAISAWFNSPLLMVFCSNYAVLSCWQKTARFCLHVSPSCHCEKWLMEMLVARICFQKWKRRRWGIDSVLVNRTNFRKEIVAMVQKYAMIIHLIYALRIQCQNSFCKNHIKYYSEWMHWSCRMSWFVLPTYYFTSLTNNTYCLRI